MRVLLQRVLEASVTVGENCVGKIGPGLLLFLGVKKEDAPETTEWMAQKVAHLRLFADDNDKMNLNIQEAKGEILVVSQFTLYANLVNGRRPDFTQSALPEPAFLLYEKFVSELGKLIEPPIQTGVFGAKMAVSLTNDGPVTFLLER